MRDSLPLCFGVVSAGTIIVFALSGGFVNVASAKKTLESAGYESIETTGWKPFTCSGSDFSSTGFVATNSAGKRISGVVCCGLIIKACTIRF